MRRRDLALFAASLVGVLILIGLGFWQLERLHWKRELLADLDRALSPTTPALSLDEAEQALARDASVRYVRVRVRGVFDHANERFLFGSLDGAPGWYLITPLATGDGHLVFVNRGFLPDDLKLQENRPESLMQGEVEMQGLVRGPPQRGLFTPHNEPAKNIWYWLDLEALFASLVGRSILEPSNLILEAEAQAGAPSWPRPVVADPRSIPNNHLQYALTWFALAAIFAFMTFLLARKERLPLG